MADSRSTLLDLVLERAATVSELAAAVGRPKSTVAHHVNVLVDAGMLKVVRTRRVRAIDERYYGRTARLFHVGVVQPERRPSICPTPLRAAAEAGPRHEADPCGPSSATPGSRGSGPRSSGTASWISSGTSPRLPRSGDTVYGFVAGLYPTDHPTLPERDDDPDGGGPVG